MGRRLPSDPRLVALAGTLAVLAAGCGGSSPSGAHARASRPAAIQVVVSRFGRILVDAHGRTLYLFTDDRHGRSRCYSGCARLWRPAGVPGRLVAGAGVTAKLTTVRRRDGRRQLVYNHHPLYTLIADRHPGEINGQGWSGTWFVVSAAGRQIGHGTPSGY